MVDIGDLQQMIDSMESAVEKLEEAQKSNKVEEFNKIKKFILDLQKRIDLEILGGEV